MLNPFTSPLDWMMSKTVLVPISAVKRFIKTPRLRAHCEALDGARAELEKNSGCYECRYVRIEDGPEGLLISAFDSRARSLACPDLFAHPFEHQ